MPESITFTVRIKLQVPIEVAFAFFEDPRSMMLLPTMIESTGSGGQGGSGRMRSRTPEGIEAVNEWQVMEFDPPQKCVIFERVTLSGPGLPRPQVLEVTETNSYRRTRGGSSRLIRHTVRRFPGLTITPSQLAVVRRQHIKREKETVRTLAAHLPAAGSSPPNE
jgi:hypothetical protein